MTYAGREGPDPAGIRQGRFPAVSVSANCNALFRLCCPNGRHTRSVLTCRLVSGCKNDFFLILRKQNQEEETGGRDRKLEAEQSRMRWGRDCRRGHDHAMAAWLEAGGRAMKEEEIAVGWKEDLRGRWKHGGDYLCWGYCGFEANWARPWILALS